MRRLFALGPLSLVILVSSCGSDGTSVGPGGGGNAGSATAGSAESSGSSSGGASGRGSAGAASGAGAGAGGSSTPGAGNGGSAGNAGNAGNAGAGASDPIPGTCAPPSNINAPYQKLSQTGCMSSTEPTKFVAKAIPYEVNSPLWSDSADKTRAMVIPAGQKVHVRDCAVPADNCIHGPADTGQWVFPVGTVMLKNFMFDSKLVETRLFVRHDDQTWVGYSYRWDEAQTDATIVPPEDNVDVMFNTGSRTLPWQYPSRKNCMKCHIASGGSTLGPETRQMNRELSGKNQIDHLAELGVFDQVPVKPYAEAYATPYVSQAGTPAASATLDQKARSYMHANCAFCHRPDGEFPQIDMRYDTKLADMGVCNVVPLKGNQGVLDAVELKPGEPASSIIYLRMNALPGAGRMPAIATNQIDTAAVKLIGDWITSVKSCPSP